VITVAVTMLALAGLLFGYRMLAGPTLADRVVGINGLLLVGMSAIVVQAMVTGRGAFLPVVVVVALVGFIGTGMVARYIEGRGR
jgi:multicomponent Na+:H+ antiporter subunit F